MKKIFLNFQTFIILIFIIYLIVINILKDNKINKIHKEYNLQIKELTYKYMEYLEQSTVITTTADSGTFGDGSNNISINNSNLDELKKELKKELQTE